MVQRIKKKIQSPKGETLSETLAAVLIVVLASSILAGSIVTSAKLNKQAKEYHSEFQKTIDNVSNVEQIPGKVTIIHKNQGSTTEERIDVEEYKTKDKNHYIYYELPKEED